MRENEGRAVYFFDDVRHCEGLARAGDTEQSLFAIAVVDARDELFDRLGLVSRRLVFGM